MSGIEDKLKDKLSICIITYNRSKDLLRTLESLKNSPVNNCRITILDNCSTDNTLSICKSFADKFSNIHFVSNHVNWGSGSANYLNCYNYCNTEYIWTLCDDDLYDFSSFDDVAGEIITGHSEIIHVGAHNDGVWDWGVYDTPRNMLKKGYHYFRYSSFMPCTIYKYSYMVQFIKEAYDYVHFRYPHLPSLVSAYNKDIPIYVSKKRIVTACIGKQRYSPYVPFRGHIVASEFLSDKESKRAICEDYYFSNRPFWYCTIVYLRRFRKEKDIAMVKNLLWYVMTLGEKIAYYVFYIPVTICLPLIKKILKHNH